VAVRREYPVDLNIWKIEIRFRKILITEHFERNLWIGFYDALECIDGKITDAIDVFIPENPAVYYNFQFPVIHDIHLI